VGSGCLPGDEKPVAKGGRTACRVVTGKGEAPLFFFFGRAPGVVVATAPIDSVVLPGGAHRFRRSPPRLYILITLSHLSRVCPPISPWGADRQHPLPPSVKGPGRRRRSSRRRCPPGSERRRRRHPAHCASTDAAASASLGGCQF